ncbi:MFS transporter [Patescibacteria group bacterium]|nr:MFS transporter [Patescibacteria group bacterium]
MSIRKTLNERLRIYGTNHRLLFSLAFLFFFFSIYEGISSYVTPLIMSQSGLNYTITGLIIGSLSVFGAVFDLVLIKFVTDTTFRRLYLLLFAVALAFPLVLWQSKHIWMFVLAMVLWGLYYDLRNFGAMDVVGRCTPEKEHASSFGVISIFKAAGSMLAPLLIGGLVAEGVTKTSLYAPYLALFAAMAMFIVVNVLVRQKKVCRQYMPSPKITKGSKCISWLNLSKILYPGLIASLLIALLDGSLWSLGSVVSESLESLGVYRGLFLTVNYLPGLFMGWFVGSLTLHYGKLNVAVYSLLVSFGFLATIYLLQSENVLLLIMMFISGCAQALVYPSVDGWFADAISQNGKMEKDTQALSDFISNLGYIIAPIFVGLLIDFFGPVQSFSIVGIVGVVLVGIYLLFIPARVRRNSPNFSATFK